MISGALGVILMSPCNSKWKWLFATVLVLLIIVGSPRCRAGAEELNLVIGVWIYLGRE